MQFDYVVIGGGPGAAISAVRASQLGKRVALVDRRAAGALPIEEDRARLQAILRSAEVYETLKKSGAYGIRSQGLSHEMPTIVDRGRGLARRISSGVEYLLKKNKVTCYSGQASLMSANQVRVEGEEPLEAQSIAIACETKPVVPTGFRIDGERVLSLHEAVRLNDLPERLAIWGDEAEAVEMAYAFRALGSEVKLLVPRSRLLPDEDHDIADEVKRAFTRKGIEIETGITLEQAQPQSNALLLTYQADGVNRQIACDAVVLAHGETPQLQGLGLEALGMAVEDDGLPVNLFQQTSISNIYAFGPAAQSVQENLAEAQGKLAAEHLTGKEPAPIDPHQVPVCTMCRPQAARLGHTEASAKAQGVGYQTGQFDFRSNPGALLSGESEGRVKLLFDEEHSALIGAHIVGGEAVEMIQQLQLALTLEATAEELARGVYGPATRTEAIREAALDVLGERIYGA